MGSHLHSRLGDGYAPVGMIAGAGRFRAHVARPLLGPSRRPVAVTLPRAAPATLEGQLAVAVPGTCIVDLTSPTPGRDVDRWLHETPHPYRSAGAVVHQLIHAWQHAPCRPGAEYDALVHLPEITPSRPLPQQGWAPPTAQRSRR